MTGIQWAATIMVLYFTGVGMWTVLGWFDDWLADRRLERIRKKIGERCDLGACPVPDKLEPLHGAALWNRMIEKAKANGRPLNIIRFKNSPSAEDPVDVDQLLAEFDADFKRTHPKGTKRL